MPIHNSTYQHWDGTHLGIWRRRWVIAMNGLRGAFQGKWMRHIAVLCWGASLIQIAFMFFLGQLLVKDSIVVRWVGTFNSALQGGVSALTGWLETHPELSVATAQNFLFYYFCKHLTVFSFLALALAIPHLITRDLGSNAIIIYSAKAINRMDYLIGKFLAVFLLLCITWLGPAVTAWLLGNLLSPHWSFFWHSRAVLGHVLLFLVLAITVLSVVALGISAIAARDRTTVAVWTLWWVIGVPLVGISTMTRPWLKYLSLNFNLNQLALGIFRIDLDYTRAQENIGFLRESLRDMRRRAPELLTAPEVTGSVIALVLILIVAVVVIQKKVRPE